MLGWFVHWWLGEYNSRAYVICESRNTTFVRGFGHKNWDQNMVQRGGKCVLVTNNDEFASHDINALVLESINGYWKLETHVWSYKSTNFKMCVLVC